MNRKQMIYIGTISLFALASVFAWNMMARAGYESAEYKVLDPDLMLVATTTKLDAQGRDGSFMKLFSYISGANETKQKISMTTPVFMENDQESSVQMGFVMPRDVAIKGVPKPTGEQVDVRKRASGRFAVVRFSGQLTTKQAKESEASLRVWMETNGFVADDSLEGSGVETAGYDPPFTPSPLRRNEVLIRLKKLVKGNDSTTPSVAGDDIPS
jgi:hypothetical protein